MNDVYNVAVIGAGASGMAAAIAAAKRNKRVLLVEKSDRPGRKILASGNGRCNLLNAEYRKYYGDPLFADSILKICSYKDITSFFNEFGLMVAEEGEGRIYPFSYQSLSVLDIMKDAMEITGVSLKTGFRVSSVLRRNNQFYLSGDKGESIVSEKVIIACGGAAQPKIGGTTDGYELLQSMGHHISSVFPSLVALNTDSKSISGLSGIRAKCKVSLYEGENLLHKEKGEVLFTDYGVSGICVMQCARFTEGRNTLIKINFLENMHASREQIVNEIERRKNIFSDLSPVRMFDGILHERISYAIMKQAGIPLRGETAGNLSQTDIISIADTAQAYRMIVTGTRGLDFAQVTAGGADCSEFDPETMESRIVPGLHAAGEVLNVDGDCGGYNLMFAFASGIIAGRSV